VTLAAHALDKTHSEVALDLLYGEFIVLLASTHHAFAGPVAQIKQMNDEKYVSEYDRGVKAVIKKLERELRALQTGSVGFGRARLHTSDFRAEADRVFTTFCPAYTAAVFEEVGSQLGHATQLRGLFSAYGAICALMPILHEDVSADVLAFETLQASPGRHCHSTLSFYTVFDCR
jgi:hypothetical protein